LSLLSRILFNTRMMACQLHDGQHCRW